MGKDSVSPVEIQLDSTKRIADHTDEYLERQSTGKKTVAVVRSRECYLECEEGKVGFSLFINRSESGDVS